MLFGVRNNFWTKINSSFFLNSRKESLKDESVGFRVHLTKGLQKNLAFKSRLYDISQYFILNKQINTTNHREHIERNLKGYSMV